MRIRRGVAMACVIVLAALAVGACGGGSKKSASDSTPGSTSGKTPASAAAGDISGTYVVVKDSDGATPKADTTVTLVLDNGNLTVHAVSPDDELTDDGTYSISDGKMTITFNEQGISANGKPYKLDGDTLELPVKMFSEGDGSSTWKRTGDAVAIATTDDAGADAGADGGPPTGAPAGTPGVTASLDADWSIYDLDKYATAAAMKTYVESVNDKGMTLEAAVRAAADKAKTFPDVTSVTVTSNKLNAVILYKDGRGEDLITERFSVTDGGVLTRAADVSEPLVTSAPVAASSCPALPSSPKTVSKVAGKNIAQPGREGLQPKGGYGVTVYDANKQPAPMTSDDSPPAAERNALLFSPLYEVPHPGPMYDKNGKAIVGTWSGFKEPSTGDNIACIKASLERGGYKVDTIVGRIENKEAVHTGIDALVELSQKLVSTKYGAIYFLTHGSAFDNNIIKLEMGTLGEDDRDKVLGNRKINHQEMTTLEDAIREEVLNRAGLPLDDDLKKTIRANVEVNGRLELWISSDFIRLLREKKGLDFSNTLVFVNACSSAANSGLVTAFNARAYFGFRSPPDMYFASYASQIIFDEVTDKGRSARNGWSMWGRYSRWLAALARRPVQERGNVDILKAYGPNGVEYPKMADQTVILIYRMRHGPASAASDIAKSVGVVQACSSQFWSSGTKTGLKSPACHNLEFGSHLPTDEEVNDAIFDVGGGGAEPYGRWTLRD